MKIVREHGPTLVIIIALLMAGLPGMVRAMTDNPVLVDGESYFNLRIGHALQENLMLRYDALQNAPLDVDVYRYLVFFMLKLTSNDQSLLMSSILFCVLSAILLYLSLVKIGMQKDRAFMAFLVYVISPIYLYASTSLTSHSLTLLLLTLSLYLYSRTMHYHRPYISAASLLPAILTVVIEPGAFILFILALLVYSSYSRRSYAYPVLGLTGGIVLVALSSVFLGQIPALELIWNLDPVNYVTDFGSLIGYPFFQLLLTFLTIALYWKLGSGTKTANFLVMILLLISTIIPGSRIFMALVLAIYTAFAIDFFIKRDWIVPILKDLTLLIVFSSLLFSSLSFGTRMMSMEPHLDTLHSLELIEEDRRQGSVLSSPSNGYFIEYYTGRRAFVDDPNSENALVAHEIFTSNSPKTSHVLLKKNNIEFIYIDPEMKKKIWKRKKGLLMVRELSENFINLGEFGGREAWLYIVI